MISRLGNKMQHIGPPLTPETNLGSLAMGLAAALHVGAESQPGLYKPKP
jgi:hypothetical protein